ncbi:hypothetical protein G6F42_014269 [Rhizopus arrhizus]|nr:hypothetical protein G6F42_014269 [Rhizopus arrhizus]
MYLDDLKESVGTIIKSTTKATDIADRKTCYFKTLAMNQILDISDISQSSHLDLFSPLQQQQIIQKLSSPKIQTHWSVPMYSSHHNLHADVKIETQMFGIGEL